MEDIAHPPAPARRATPRSPLAFVFGCVVTLGAASPLFAQPVGGEAPARTRWLTEAGYSYAFRGACADHYPSFEAGPIVDLGPRVALGATGVVGHNAELVYGAKARLRLRANDDFSFEIAAGGLGGDSEARPTGHAGIAFRDLVSLVLQYEVDRSAFCGEPRETQLFLGGKIGSRAGLVTGVVGSAIGAIIVLVVVSGIEN